MAESFKPSGLYDRSPEELRRELMDLVVPNRKLFTNKEYGATLKALLQMKADQYESFKKRISETIAFRSKHKVTNAGTAKLF